MDRGVRTVQRWEKEEGLPVHRQAHAKQGRVYAFRDEIDAWWESRRVSLQYEGAFAARFKSAWASVALALIAAAMVLGGALIWLPRSPAPPELATPTPIETFRGWKFFPSFSPDGREVVFTLSAPHRNVDLYAKRIGEPGLRQVTDDLALDLGASWSPDGQWIAVLNGFRTEGPKRNVMIIPAAGGEGIKLAETAPDWGPFLSWMPAAA